MVYFIVVMVCGIMGYDQFLSDIHWFESGSLENGQRVLLKNSWCRHHTVCTKQNTPTPIILPPNHYSSHSPPPKASSNVYHRWYRYISVYLLMRFSYYLLAKTAHWIWQLVRKYIIWIQWYQKVYPFFHIKYLLQYNDKI